MLCFCRYSTYCKIWPDGGDNPLMPMKYALQLLCGPKESNKARVVKAKKALEIIKPIIGIITPEFPASGSVYGEFCELYTDVCYLADAESHMEDVLRHALLVPTDTEESKAQAIRVLRHIHEYAALKNDADPKRENQTMFDIEVQAAEKIYGIHPIPDTLYNIAVAHCKNGDNFKGAKVYRRILASPGNMDMEDIGDLERSLIIAQLQCPGMPLEDYILFSERDGILDCIHKDSKDDFEVQSKKEKFIVKAKKQLAFLKYQIPKSPNDPKVFSTEFLDSLK